MPCVCSNARLDFSLTGSIGLVKNAANNAIAAPIVRTLASNVKGTSTFWTKIVWRNVLRENLKTKSQRPVFHVHLPVIVEHARETQTIVQVAHHPSFLQAVLVVSFAQSGIGPTHLPGFVGYVLKVAQVARARAFVAAARRTISGRMEFVAYPALWEHMVIVQSLDANHVPATVFPVKDRATRNAQVANPVSF